MIVVYTIMSFFLIFVRDLIILEPPNQTILGVILFCYALFRIYKLKQQRSESNDQ